MSQRQAPYRRRDRRRARADCRRGHHRYGSGQEIGGGIVRRVCLACGAVSIDLTGATQPHETRLFTSNRRQLPESE